MSRRRIWPAALVVMAMAAPPAQAEDLWSSFKKGFDDLTDSIKGGIGDIRQGKKDVEETIDEANQLKEEFAGTPDEPRYDSAWVSELQQRLAVQGFDPGPVDGAFGKRTANAIVAFQRQTGAEPDGLPRPSLMRAVRARTQTVQIAQPPQQPQPGALSPADGPGATTWSTAPAGAASVGALSSSQISPGEVSSSPVSSVSGAPRDATYERVLEAHLALHPELVEDDAFALQYLSYQPSGQECAAEFELLKGGEFDRQRFYTEVWPAWKTRFEEIVSQARPPTGEVFRAQLEKAAGTYDFAKEAFPVTLAGSEVVVGQNRMMPSSLSGMKFCANPSGRGRFPVGFGIDLANADAINSLPLGAAEAEAFARRNPERTLRFVVDFALEETAEAGHVGGTGKATGRIVGAAVVDPASGQVLYRYDPSTFAPPSADPWDVYPAPDYRELLLSLVARSPELARSEAYVLQYIATQACDALRDTQDNEVRRQELIAQWRPGFEQEAAGARGQRPPLVSVTLEQRLDEYDVARQTFGFPDNSGLNRYSPSYVQVRRAYCPIGLNDAPNSFGIVLEPSKPLFQAGLPVPPDVAQRLLDREVRGRKRTVHLDLLLRLGTPGEVDGNPQRVAATIVDARAREMDGGVLHHYGTGFFGADGPASAEDAYAGLEEPSHERLTLAYLASRPELADDPSFAQRYASATNCEAWRAESDDEFARGELGQQARQRILDALAQGQGETDARYRVSIETKLGEYDFGKQRFPLAVPVFDQKIYRNLLGEQRPAVLIEAEGKSCRRESVASPSFPDGFLLTTAGAEAVDAVGVPLDQAAAKAFLQRDLPAYRDPRAVRIEMVVQIGEISGPRQTHPQRDEHVSTVSGTVRSARVVDAHSGQPVFDYGAEPFGGSAAAPTALASAEPPLGPLTGLASATAEPAVAAVDDAPDMANTQVAMLAVEPPTAEQPADERSADHFKILDVTIGMTEAEAAAAVAAEFSPDQIASDPERGVLLAERGPCNHADPRDPAIASEVGAFCLALEFTDGLVSQVALRQVVPGDVTAAALGAFGERYGEPVLLEQGDPAAVSPTVVGWGAPIDADRTALGRVAAPFPPTVLEGNVWHANGVTTAVLRLDQEVQEAAPSVQIKF